MEYPLKQWGGVEVLVKELLAGLHGEYEILLASDDTPETLAEAEPSRFVAAHFPWNPRRDSRERAAEFSAWLLENRAGLVHFHLGGTYALGTRSLRNSPIPVVARSGIPCIATNHGAFSLFDFCAPWRPLAVRLGLLPLFWAGRARTLLSLRREITVSDNDLGNMRRWFFPFRDKFQRIYHSQLNGDEAINEDRGQSILCLGTIGPRKGQIFLVEAFARIAERFPAWKLIIAGRQDAGGSEMRRMEATVARHHLQDRVQLAGAVSVEEARRLMLSCGIFAMPSLAEGLGLSLQEALFSGCPAVASRVGGIQDMVLDGQTGWLAEPGDVRSLADTLALAMTSPTERRIRGKAARGRIAQLGMTRAHMVAEHLALYREVGHLTC